jgi:hypothetical protein
MKMMRALLIALAVFLLSTPAMFAQDLSKYRTFSLGMRLAALSKQVDARPDQVSVIYQTPALIQELMWWPIESYQSPARSEAVEQIRFSFYNRELYKIAATYDGAATQGLSTDDMVQAISATYGTATRPPVDTNAPAHVSYSSTDIQVALWENSQYSVTLFRSPLSASFQLVMLSKQLNDQAEAAIAEAVAQEREDAPQTEIARVKKEADDLAITRQANLKAFRP